MGISQGSPDKENQGRWVGQQTDVKTFTSRTGSRSPHLTEQPTLSLQEKRKPGLRGDRAGSRVGFTLGAASMQRAFPTSRDEASRQYPAHDDHVGQRHSPGGHECPEQDTEGPKGPQAHRRHSHGEQQRLRWAATLTPPHPQPTCFWEQGPGDSD